jgi:glycosyltransferase 2 family protein
VGEAGAKVGTRPPRRRGLRIAIQVGVTLLIFGFLVLTVADQWSELRDKGVRFDVIWLLPAFLVLPLFYIFGAIGWELIVRFLGYRLRPVRAQVVWGQPLLARYVPGSVSFIFARVLLAERAGIPRRITLASIVYELAIGTIASFAVGCYFFIDHPDLQGELWRWAVLALLPLSIAVLHPRIFGPLSAWALGKFGREPLPKTMPMQAVLAMLGFYVVMWVLIGIGVFFVARSVHPFPLSEIAEVGAAQSLANVAAVMSLVAPAGLGVRDAAFAWAVKGAGVTFGVGALIAIAVRAVLTIIEVLYVGGVTLIGRREKWVGPHEMQHIHEIEEAEEAAEASDPRPAPVAPRAGPP